MKIDLTITKNSTKENIKLDIPTGWDQVKFIDFVNIADAKGDIIKILSILTGLDELDIRKAKIHNLNMVTACLSFLSNEIIYKTPSKILGYKIASNLDTESIAQYSDIQAIIKEFKEGDMRYNYLKFPLIVATYAVDPYDFNEAEKIQTEFLNAPCTEVLAVANFTLVKLNALSRGIIPTYHHQRVTLLNRFKRDLRRWLINLISIIRFYSWKKSLPLNEQNFLNGR